MRYARPPMASVFWKKLSHRYIWKRIFYERLTEPVHLNVLSMGVAAFGSFRAKVDWDLVLRAHHAYSILKCGDLAHSLGLPAVTIVEFGVAAGAGLLNMRSIADRVTETTGVEFRVVGFDTGRGMPPPRDHRDHPDLYQSGDFPMDVDALRARLPPGTELVIGDVRDTVPGFVSKLASDAPLGFVSIDVDYYSSTVDALRVFDGQPTQYLPRTLVYLDDVEDEAHNVYCGELAALRDFNEQHELRKFDRNAFLRANRIFRNAKWIDHMFTLHVLDHPTRSVLSQERKKVVLSNPYL